MILAGDVEFWRIVLTQMRSCKKESPQRRGLNVSSGNGKLFFRDSVLSAAPRTTSGRLPFRKNYWYGLLGLKAAKRDSARIRDESPAYAELARQSSPLPFSSSGSGCGAGRRTGAP